MGERHCRKRDRVSRFFSLFILLAFCVNSVITPAQAQLISNLPRPGEMVKLSAAYNPALMLGVKPSPDNPFLFDFIVTRGDDNLEGPDLQDEGSRLIKYFLAAITIPDEESWVNLSPYEEDRIIPDALSQTEMGRDMLAQDYILKQISASLTNPQEKLGETFWSNVYKKAQAQYGTSQIPINTFNKVWIVPDQATVIEQDGTAFVADSHLKVMLEGDYTSLKANLNSKKFGTENMDPAQAEALNSISSSIVKEIIIPELEREVNQGKNFASVRQIYNSVILAVWYKRALKDTLLGKLYMDQNKITGVDVDDKEIKQKIYDRYLAAFRQGVYSLIKEDYDPASQARIPRKYFSGGLELQAAAEKVTTVYQAQPGTNGTTDFVQVDAAGNTVKVSAERTAELNAGMQNIIEAADIQSTAGNASQKTVVLQAQLTEANAEQMGVATKVQAQVQQFLNMKPQDIRAKVDQLRVKLGVSPVTAEYLYSMTRKLHDQLSGVKGAAPLEIGKNFTPTAMMTEQDVEKQMGVIDLNTVLGDAEAQKAAQNVYLLSKRLNAGFGTNYTRPLYKQWLADNGYISQDAVGLKAKSQDLGFFAELPSYTAEGEAATQRVWVSENEAEHMQLIKALERGELGRVEVMQMVNEDSSGPMAEFYDSTYLLDRLDNRPDSPKRTWRQALESGGNLVISPEMMQLHSLPGVDANSGNFNLKTGYNGGHGQVGFIHFLNLLTEPIQPNQITEVVNADGINNSFPGQAAGYMESSRIPIFVMTTDRQAVDSKGGILGMRTYDTGQAAPGGMELANAKALGDAEKAKFEGVGLKEDGGRRGGQLFNTNNVAFNDALLQPFLRELVDIIGVEEYRSIIAPDLIPSKKEYQGQKLTQVEGALLTSVLSLNAYLVTTDNQKVRDLMAKYNFDRLVYFLNVPAGLRAGYFTPQKTPADQVIYESDLFAFDAQSFRLQQTVDRLLPEVVLTGYYTKDVAIGLTALGQMGLKEAEHVEIIGDVFMPNFNFKGNVLVMSNFEGVFDLDLYLKSHPDVVLTEQGRPVLDNVTLRISPKGEVTVTNYQPKTDLEAAQKLLADHQLNLRDYLDGVYMSLAQMGGNVNVQNLADLFDLPLDEVEETLIGEGYILDARDQSNMNYLLPGTVFIRDRAWHEFRRFVAEEVSAREQLMNISGGAFGQVVGLFEKMVREGYVPEVITAPLNVENYKTLTAQVLTAEEAGQAADFIAQYAANDRLFSSLNHFMSARTVMQRNLANPEKVTDIVKAGFYVLTEFSYGATVDVATLAADMDGTVSEEQVKAILNAMTEAQAQAFPDGKTYYTRPIRGGQEDGGDVTGPVSPMSTPVQDALNNIARNIGTAPVDVLGMLKTNGNITEQDITDRTDVVKAVEAYLLQEGYTQSGSGWVKGNPGGIDFDPRFLDLQIKRNGQGVPLPLLEQNLEQIHIDGLYPVIINVAPATIQNFPFLMSAQDVQPQEQLSSL